MSFLRHTGDDIDCMLQPQVIDRAPLPTILENKG